MRTSPRPSPFPAAGRAALTFTLLLTLTSTMPATAQDRMPPIPEDRMTPEQKAAVDEFKAVRNTNRFGGPFVPLAP